MRPCLPSFSLPDYVFPNPCLLPMFSNPLITSLAHWRFESHSVSVPFATIFHICKDNSSTIWLAHVGTEEDAKDKKEKERSDVLHCSGVSIVHPNLVFILWRPKTEELKSSRHKQSGEGNASHSAVTTLWCMQVWKYCTAPPWICACITCYLKCKFYFFFLKESGWIWLTGGCCM